MNVQQVNKFLRWSLIFFFVGIFIYQTAVALAKYFESPTVVMTSTIPSSQQTRPRIIVCPTKFPWSGAGIEFGYPYPLAMLMGQVNDNSEILSWTGQYKNESWENMVKMIADNTSDHTKATEYFDILWGGGEMSQVKFFCNKIDGCGEMTVNFTNTRLTMASTKSLCIIFVDPFRMSHYRISNNAMVGDKICTSPPDGQGGNNPIADYFYYNVYTSIQTRRPEKTGCKNYESPSDYGDCIEGVVTKKLIGLLGCIPPWFVTVNQYKVCTTVERNATKDKVLKEFYDDVMYGNKVKLEGDICPPHCVEMTFKVEKVSTEIINSSHNWIMFMFTEIVVFNKEVASYDGFSLLVEIGSSLGLWIGLSALSIYDLCMDASVHFKTISKNFGY